MRKLNVKTVKESPGLVKAESLKTWKSEFPKKKILELIKHAKDFEKGKGIDTLKKIVDDYAKKGYATNPGALSFEIKDTGEKAYQRAIFLSDKTKFNTGGEVVWNDLELPVVFSDRSRRRCVDLIGTLNNKTPVLCELKFASKKYHSDSPMYAAIELMIYHYLIQDNCEELDNRNVFHKNKRGEFKWSDFTYNSVLIVGANKTYWDHWNGRYKKQQVEIGKWFLKLPEVRFFCYDDLDFKKQKEAKGKYLPNISGKLEWTEVNL